MTISLIPKVSTLLTAAVISSGISIASADVLHIAPHSVEAKAWVIYDSQTHQVIDSYAADEQRSPASLTKMMVAYLILQAVQQHKISLNQRVRISNTIQNVQSDESQMHLQVGDEVTVNELLSGLIVMSANDAALTLAELVGGDVPHFVEQMNQTALQLNMQHSHFVNPSGVTMPGHYTSAYDMAILGQAIIQNTPLYLYYSKQQTFQYKTLHHDATNLLLKQDMSVDGLKTGFTTDAGYNLALTANREDAQTHQPRRLIVVVMGTQSKQQRADVAYRLLNIAYQYTQNQPLTSSTYKIADIPTQAATINPYPLSINTQNSMVTTSLLPHPMIIDARDYDDSQQKIRINNGFLVPQSKAQQVTYQIHLHQTLLKAPMNTTLSMADLNVSQFNQPITRINLQLNPQLQQAPLWQRMWQNITYKIAVWLGHEQMPTVYNIYTKPA